MQFPTIEQQIRAYVTRIASMRANARSPLIRDAYTVALGQLLATGLIDRDTYDTAMGRKHEVYL